MSITYVEINEEQLNEKRKSIYSQLAIARDAATITYILAETRRPTNNWGSLIVGKGECFRSVVIRSCWHGKVLGRPTRSHLF